MRTGLIIGKFMPPHRGHQFLIHFAEARVDRLHVVVESVRDEPIPSALRFAWMQQLFPGCSVHHLQTHQPQHPDEHPDFWPLWRRTLRGLLPEEIDCVFASEAYGRPLAQVLGARFIPVDPSRSACPISATQIRAAPHQSWAFMDPIVRRHFVRKICIFGPESTGKTTLAQRLAAHFDGTFLPEYARTYLEARGGEIAEADLLEIARGQAASEAAMLRQSRPLLICDTDPLSTTIWSRWLYQRCDPRIEALAAQHDYALTLLLDVDVPWEDGLVRYLPEGRAAFFADCRRALQRAGRHTVEIRGSWDARWERAVRAVEAVQASVKLP